MKKAALALLLALLPVTSFAFQSPEFSVDQSIITVTGSGYARMEVDLATVSGAVVTQATTVTQAQRDNAKIFNDLISTMRSIVGEKDFRSSGYSVFPVYKYPQGQESVLIGYSVRHSFQIRVAKIYTLGTVIDAMGTVGANLFESVTFSNSNRKKYEMEALGAAMKDAQEKASIIASANGRALKQVLKVNYNPVVVPESTVSREEMSGSGTTIVPGELSVIATVSAEFEF